MIFIICYFFIFNTNNVLSERFSNSGDQLNIDLTLLDESDRFEKRLDNIRKYDLQSDYGIFVQNEDEHTELPFGTTTKINNNESLDSERPSKQPRWPRFHTKGGSSSSTDNANLMDSILHNYLHKLYTKRYKTNVESEIDEDSESKFLEGTTNVWNIKNKTKQLAKKLLSIFTIVQFPNSACQATSIGIDYMGICYHQSECDLMNGTALGNCAEGYGVCCVYKYTCGETSSQNCTYLESPGYPNYDPNGGGTSPPNTATMPPLPPTQTPPPPTQNPSPTPDPRLSYFLSTQQLILPSKVPSYYQQHERYRRSTGDTQHACSLSVNKVSDNVRQFRIDFLDLELSSPTNGTCMQERLVINGRNVVPAPPEICGYNTGQHMYVDVANLEGPLQISVLSTTGAPKRYRLRVCQIADDCDSLAPSQCLQYYTGTSGTISSFNYDQAASNNRSVPGYLNNLNYAVCVRKEAGYCSVTYTNVLAGREYPFQIRNVDNNGVSTIPPGQAGVEIFNCPNQYITIGGTRLCGDKLNDASMDSDFTRNAPITDDSAGPAVIQVRTDSGAPGRGFKLFYTQNRCQ